MSKTSEIRLQTWTAPLAANATLLLSAQSLNGSTVTSFLSQLIYARVLQVVASGSTTANVTITGTDISGNVISEVLALNGTTPVNTVNAYQSVTSLVLPTVASTTLNFGTTNLLGLDNYCDEHSFSLLTSGQKEMIQQTWAAPAAASATYVHAAISTAVVTTTAITNPDFPRIVSITGAGSSHAATGNVVINGTDILGATISDTIALSSSSTVNGVKAFATVTSIDATGVTGIDTNDTVQVGIAAALGLNAYCDAYSFAGFAGESSYTSSATVISQNTVVTSTAPNGSANIAVVFYAATNPNKIRPSSFTYSPTVISQNYVSVGPSLNGVKDIDVHYFPSTFAAFGRGSE